MICGFLIGAVLQMTCIRPDVHTLIRKHPDGSRTLFMCIENAPIRIPITKHTVGPDGKPIEIIVQGCIGT